MRGIRLVLLLEVMSGVVYSQDYYCKFSSYHTNCRYRGVSSQCGNLYSQGLSSSEQSNVLDAHNRLRARVASGQTNQPSAANMMKLEWDSELASVAQRLADLCKYGHDCSSCRKVSRFNVGQNIFVTYGYLKDGTDWNKALRAWFDDEINLFPTSYVSPFRYIQKTGHYSQLMWAETTTVGCGFTSYTSGQFVARLYVCNYGPGGNRMGGEMYRIGQSCTQCPSQSTCSFTYPGLCTSSPSSFSSSSFIPTSFNPSSFKPTSYNPSSYSPSSSFVPSSFNPVSSFVPSSFNPASSFVPSSFSPSSFSPSSSFSLFPSSSSFSSFPSSSSFSSFPSSSSSSSFSSFPSSSSFSSFPSSSSSSSSFSSYPSSSFSSSSSSFFSRNGKSLNFQDGIQEQDGQEDEEQDGQEHEEQDGQEHEEQDGQEHEEQESPKKQEQDEQKSPKKQEQDEQESLKEQEQESLEELQEEKIFKDLINQTSVEV